MVSPFKILGWLTPDLPVRGGFPPHIDSALLPNKFQNIVADYGGTRPINISLEDPLEIKLTFETKGPPFYCKVGAGLRITTDVRFLRPDEKVALWLSATKFIAPSADWAKQEVVVRGTFSPDALPEMDKTVDVLKAIQVGFRSLNISGDDMLLTEWDNDVYRVGQRPLPNTAGQALLTIFGEGLGTGQATAAEGPLPKATGTALLSVFGE